MTRNADIGLFTKPSMLKRKQPVWIQMEHRHINIKDKEWNAAVVHSIWERGLEKDICALIREVKTNAKAVDAVRNAIPHSKVYGWPKFFKLYIEKIHGQK